MNSRDDGDAHSALSHSAGKPSGGTGCGDGIARSEVSHSAVERQAVAGAAALALHAQQDGLPHWHGKR